MATKIINFSENGRVGLVYWRRKGAAEGDISNEVQFDINR